MTRFVDRQTNTVLQNVDTPPSPQLALFAVDTIQTAPEAFTSIIALGVLSVVLDALVRRGRHRRSPGPPEQQPSTSPPG